MTKEQIEIYEICKKDLNKLEEWSEKLPFKGQNHGCGSQDAAIHFELEKIHKEMYSSVFNAMKKAKTDIEERISKL